MDTSSPKGTKDKPLKREDIEQLLAEVGHPYELDLSGQDLRNIDLSGLNLSGANLSRTILYSANLTKTT